MKQNNANQNALDDYNGHKVLYLLHKILLCISLSSLTIIVLQYWVLVYDDFSFRSIQSHGLSLIPIVTDFVLSLERLLYKNGIWVILFCVCYTLWSIIFSAANMKTGTGRSYLYTVLDWNESIGISVATTLYTYVFIFAVLSFYTVCKNTFW